MYVYNNVCMYLCRHICIMYECGTLWVCMNLCMYNIMCCFQLLHISYIMFIGPIQYPCIGFGLLHPGNKLSQGQSVETITFSNYFHLISVPAISIYMYDRF